MNRNDRKMKEINPAKLNIFASLLVQLVSGVCGLILPRVVLASFGSEANGLVASIAQLLGYTVLLEGGIGGVMRAALYKPLASGDMAGVSDIYHSIGSSFRRISHIFIGFAFVLAVVMKFLVDTQFHWLYVFSLVLILSCNTYFNYYSALPQRLLMTADQKLYIIQFTQSVTMVANLLMCLLVLRMGGGIHAVKFTSMTVYLLNPLVMRGYVKRHYLIREPSAEIDTAIPQKRDGVIHHLSYFVHSNTDVVILSLFSTLADISVYSVYHTVLNILGQLLGSISSGLSSSIGNLIARNEIKQLKCLIDKYEAWNNALTTAVTTVCSIMILPFVSVYTSGVTDAQYIRPMFAGLMIAGSYAYSVRHPFGSVVAAAGHYRQTNFGAIVEVALNLGLSLLLVKPLGIVGVALGTFVAMTFRTIYTVWYLSRNILCRPVYKFLLSLICNLAVSVLLIYWVPQFIGVTASNILGLLICAVKVSLVVFPVFFALNGLLSFRTVRGSVAESGK